MIDISFPVQIAYSVPELNMSICVSHIIIPTGMIDINQYVANAPVKIELWHEMQDEEIGTFAMVSLETSSVSTSASP